MPEENPEEKPQEKPAPVSVTSPRAPVVNESISEPEIEPTSVAPQGDSVNPAEETVSEQETTMESLSRQALLLADFSIRVTKLDWNRYFFESNVVDPEGYSMNWRFGDGTESFDSSAEHTYDSTGTYKVVLSVSTLDGSSTTTDEVTIRIGFFNIGNPWLWSILAFLIVFVVLCLYFAKGNER